MTRIFISYRRIDSQYVTDSIHDHLIRHFGESNVFLDVGSIPFGVDFRQYLADQVAAHDVVLVIIGPDWGRLMQERADQDNDFVRIEIESALQQGKRVIPVLVKEARMPSFQDLPASIADLQYRNAATIRRKPDLEHDCKRLADGIQDYLNLQPSADGSRATPKPQSRAVKTLFVRSEDLMPPPFAWIDIPAGRVKLENLRDNDQTYVGRKGQSKAFDVPAFQIAKYPITNAQFATFIEAGGYDNSEWWTKAGWDAKQKGWHDDVGWKPSGKPWTEPCFWGAEEWNGTVQPVVGVSWYEAVAFCLWLSEASGEQIMLPTEQQWQRAAQGDDERVYPWSNEWDSSRCRNSVDSRSSGSAGNTSIVTAYEGKGDSTYGVVDMSGNVWEWCLTEYYSGKQGLANNNTPVLRGGSWVNSNPDSLRVAARVSLISNGRDALSGFRIARY